MANEYLRLNSTKINIEKAKNLMAVITEKRKNVDTKKENQSEDSLFQEVYKAFKDFFSKLGKPTLQKRLQKKQSPPVSRDYNDTLREIYQDIQVAYSQEDSLANVIVRDFNYNEAERKTLLNKLKKINSRSLDYSMYFWGAKEKSLYAMDNFIDNSKLDSDLISLNTDQAELIPESGVVTLKRTSNISKNTFVDKVTGIRESIPPWNSVKETGGYEGLYFGNKNEARPEGGKWNISYSDDGKTLYEVGANETDLLKNRMKMFDDNPDTFWEVEYVTDPVIAYVNKYDGIQLSVAQFNELVLSEINSSNVNVVGESTITDDKGSVITQYNPITESGENVGLSMSFTILLKQPEIINWISLLPNNFGQEKYIRIESIQLSSDGQSFSEIGTFDDYNADNTLSSVANSALSSKETLGTLSPDRFKYAGIGLWVFSPKPVKAIRFYIKQASAYLKTYDVMRVETQQVITTVTTEKKWWGKKKESTERRTVTQEIDIPYLVGQIAGFDVMSLEPGGVDISVADTTALYATGGAIAGAIAGAQVGAAGGPIGMAVGAILGAVLGSLFGSKKKSETTVGEQTISRQWLINKNDKERFAIGIRDINLFANVFAESSEIVSKEYFSPKPISKIKLHIEESIPSMFYLTEGMEKTRNDWIKYYISIDNGVSWNRISPTTHGMTLSKDGINYLPEIININSDIEETERDNPLAYIDSPEPVRSVRFKAVLSRPSNIKDAEHYTPVLSQYALQIYPLGGL